MENKTPAQVLREWMEKLSESTVDLDMVKDIIDYWVQDPDSIDHEKAAILLNTPEAQQCKKPRGSVIYRALAVPAEKLEALLNGETIDMSPFYDRGFVAYSYSSHEAHEAAFNFDPEDQVIVFHKQLHVDDLIIDLDEFKGMLGMHDTHRNEQELWMKDSPYYCHFSLQDTNLDEEQIDELRQELGIE